MSAPECRLPSANNCKIPRRVLTTLTSWRKTQPVKIVRRLTPRRAQTLDRLNNRRRVQLTVARAHQRIQMLRDQRRGRQTQTELARVFHPHAHILLVQLHFEPRLEHVIEHAAPVHLEDLAAREST